MKEEKFDILTHEMVPEHTILTEEERQEVMDKLNISLKQFPSIALNDAVVKKLGGKFGDLIKIKRKSPTSGEAYYYRVVVND